MAKAIRQIGLKLLVGALRLAGRRAPAGWIPSRRRPGLRLR